MKGELCDAYSSVAQTLFMLGPVRKVCNLEQKRNARVDSAEIIKQTY